MYSVCSVTHLSGCARLFSSLADRPEREHAISLPACSGQKKREARIGTHFGAVTLRRPKNRPVAPGAAARQTVFLFEAREPPPVVRPAHWRLLAGHRVESFEQARWITQLYRRRRAIEQLFRAVKSSGFDIERMSVEAAPFGTLCAMTLAAASPACRWSRTATAAPHDRSGAVPPSFRPPTAMRKNYETKKKSVLVLMEGDCQIAFVRCGSGFCSRRPGAVAVPPRYRCRSRRAPHPPAAFPWRPGWTPTLTRAREKPW